MDGQSAENRQLFEACRAGDVESVDIIVNNSSNINLNYIHHIDSSSPERDKGKTPLIVAIQGQHKSIIQKLIKAGVDVNLRGLCKIGSGTVIDYIPLNEALLQRFWHTRGVTEYQDIVKMLLDAGADFKCPETVDLVLQQGLRDILAMFIESGLDINEITFIRGHSLLGHAFDLIYDQCMELADLSLVHDACTLYGGTFNHQELVETEFVHNIVEKLIQEAVILREYPPFRDLQLKISRMQDIFLCIMGEGFRINDGACISFPGIYTNHPVCSFFERCLLCGLTNLAKVFWAAGSHRGLSTQWNASNMSFDYCVDGQLVHEGDMEETVIFLETIVRQPRTLQESARIVFRSVVSPGKMSKVVGKLKLPSALVGYLLLKDVSKSWTGRLGREEDIEEV